MPLDDQLPDEYYPLLPLFSECVAKLGSKNYSYEKLAEEIKLHTGGISASPFIHAPYSPLFSRLFILLSLILIIHYFLFINTI